jgi:hypothetical protein
MFRRAVLASLVALSIAAAHAQSAPKGWKVEVNANAWIAMSPEQVRLAYYPVAKTQSAMAFWFEDEGLRHAYAYGKSVANQASAAVSVDPEAGRLLGQSRTLLDAGANQIAVMSYAWDTPKGHQLAQIVMPVSQAKSAAYDTAFAELTKAYKAGFAYVPVIPGAGAKAP